jgi:glucosylceramidase
MPRGSAVPRTGLSALVTAILLGLALVAPPTASAASTATVNGAQIHQPIDGFGFSEAFGRGAIMHGSEGLSAARQRQVLDLLLSPTAGAGLSILRLHIGSTANSSIQPTNPGGPNATSGTATTTARCGSRSRPSRTA